MEFRGIMGGFYRISEWIMRLSVINVLWIVCSIPFVFVVFPLFTVEEITADFLRQYLLILGIVAPFTLIPATGAMFTVARKWVTGDVDVPLFKTYFRGYKENYRQSMLGALVFELIAAVLYVNYYFYSTQTSTLKLLSFLFLLFMVLLGAAFLNYMSIMVHFHMKFWQIVKNALLLTIGNPLNSIAILVLNGVVFYFSTRFTFLIPFFMGSIISVVSFFMFYRSFERLREKVQKSEEEAEENAEKEGAGDVEQLEAAPAQEDGDALGNKKS